MSLSMALALAACLLAGFGWLAFVKRARDWGLSLFMASMACSLLVFVLPR